MFIVTEEWLKENYGSANKGQELQASMWLSTYGVGITLEKDLEWQKWKHLIEYQVNTNDIVPLTLEMIGKKYDSELQAHRIINLMRVPLASSYEQALEVVRPITILELGVGGDSAISTAVFLAYIEGVRGRLFSVDINPLGKTWDRYRKYAEQATPLWKFKQDNSINVLKKAVNTKVRFDMVFIDTSHSYSPTVQEIELSSQISNNILLDDATFEGNPGDDVPGGVKRAIEWWLEYSEFRYPGWGRIDLWGGAVALLRKE